MQDLRSVAKDSPLPPNTGKQNGRSAQAQWGYSARLRNILRFRELEPEVDAAGERNVDATLRTIVRAAPDVGSDAAGVEGSGVSVISVPTVDGELRVGFGRRSARADAVFAGATLDVAEVARCSASSRHVTLAACAILSRAGTSSFAAIERASGVDFAVAVHHLQTAAVHLAVVGPGRS